MDSITLKSKANIPIISATAGQQTVQGSLRSILTFKFEAVGGLDALLTQLADTSEISIISGAETFFYSDYTIPIKRAIENELVTPETPDTPATYRDVYIVSLAQKTYLEKTVEKLLGA
jgi:hypothetical protein